MDREYMISANIILKAEIYQVSVSITILAPSSRRLQLHQCGAIWWETIVCNVTSIISLPRTWTFWLRFFISVLPDKVAIHAKQEYDSYHVCYYLTNRNSTLIEFETNTSEIPSTSSKMTSAFLPLISMLFTSPPPESRLDWKYTVSSDSDVPSGNPETKIRERSMSISRNVRKHVD